MSLDLIPEEINVAIEAIAFRAKMIRKKLDENKQSPEDAAKNAVNFKLLNGLLKKLLPLQEKPAKEESAPATSKQDYSQYRLLIVDDEEVSRQMIHMILSDHGFSNIDMCNDGHEAIALIKGDKTNYDLVFCDWNMPIMSGFDVLKILRQSNTYRKLPFIMVSGERDVNRLKEAMQAGVSDYVIKPVDATKLTKKVDTLLRR